MEINWVCTVYMNQYIHTYHGQLNNLFIYKEKKRWYKLRPFKHNSRVVQNVGRYSEATSIQYQACIYQSYQQQELSSSISWACVTKTWVKQFDFTDCHVPVNKLGHRTDKPGPHWRDSDSVTHQTRLRNVVWVGGKIQLYPRSLIRHGKCQHIFQVVVLTVWETCLKIVLTDTYPL